MGNDVRFSIFFPMAAPSGPVGYAQVLVGPAQPDLQRLPLQNFDVRTVAEAWGSLFDGQLWPATPPEGSLAWRPAFMGGNREVEAGRSKGKSAHLAVLLAVSAWQAGRLAESPDGALNLWASGELDLDGRLCSVEQLSDKLRLFLEHFAVHGRPSLFVAPAANRSTADLTRLRSAVAFDELHFDPRAPACQPPGARPAVLWVNRADVGALARCLARPVSGHVQAPGPGRRPAGKRSRWALLLGLLALAGPFGAAHLAGLTGHLLTPAAGHDALTIPAALTGSAFVLRTEHAWHFDPDTVAGAIQGARSQGDAVVWEEPATNHQAKTSGVCGETNYLPRKLRLRYVLTSSRFFSGTIGTVSESLAVLRPPFGTASMQHWPERHHRDNALYRYDLFDPRETLLYAGLATHARNLMEQGLLQGDPSNIDEMWASQARLLNHLDDSVYLVYQASRCCSRDNACYDRDPSNDFCPQPSGNTFGSSERSFELVIGGPRHAYVGLAALSDNRNRSRIEADGDIWARCDGPHQQFNHLLDRFPSQVQLIGERSWSHTGQEFSAAFVADSVLVKNVRQQPAIGLGTGVFPRVVDLEPGWHRTPRTRLRVDFQQGVPDPFVPLSGEVAIDGGRLKLVRSGGEVGRAAADLGKPVQGAFSLAVTLELLTDQSQVSVCLLDSAWATQICLTLATKTENASNPGAHLSCLTSNINFSVLAEHLPISHRFEPGVGAPHRLRLDRNEAGTWRLTVDGVAQGAAQADCLVQRFDRIELTGYQDSNPGHGGFVDDLVISQ